jgi:hypothetical protein
VNVPCRCSKPVAVRTAEPSQSKLRGQRDEDRRSTTAARAGTRWASAAVVGSGRIMPPKLAGTGWVVNFRSGWISLARATPKATTSKTREKH